MRKITKMLLIISTILIVTLLLNFYVVKAASVQSDIMNTTVGMNLEKMSDTIEVGMPTTKAFETYEMSEELGNKVMQLVKVATSEDVETNYIVSISFKTSASNSNLVDLSKIEIVLQDKSYKEIDKKVVTVKYTDTNWNENDKKYIENKFKINEELEIKGLEIDINDTYYNPTNQDASGYQLLEKNICTEFEKQINDSKIKCVRYDITKASWGWPEYYQRGNLQLSTNGVVYYVISTLIHATPMITIPSNIEDTEEAYMAYAAQVIVQKCDWLSEEDVADLKKGTKQDEYILGGISILLKKKVTAENPKPEETTKIVSKESAETKIKLDSNNSVVSGNIILEAKPINDGKTFEQIKSVLEKNMKFKAFDITLKLDNEKVQPNGKVKISIPIPSEFNKEKLVVYRIEDNGNKIEYAVKVEGEYATFETDHFSNYVLAEKVVQDSKKLDEEPKTGENNYVVLVSFAAIISLIGISIIKKENNK